MPPDYSRVKGFTLIELLVVISIIAIISVVATAIFSGLTKKAEDGRKKADVDTIAKAFEVAYNPASGSYRDVVDSDFAAGVIPVPPDGGEYTRQLSPDGSGFRICAALEGNPQQTCSAPSSTCFCRDSSQGIYVAGPTPTPAGPTPTPSPTPISTPTPTPISTPTPTPTGPTPTPTPTPAGGAKRVFVTNTTYTGALGGLAGADQKCQSSADGAGLGGIWVAWLSDSVTAASTRVTQTTANYVRIDGVIVANGWTDLTDGSLDVAINITETGVAPTDTNNYVFTFTNANGTIYTVSPTYHCENWTNGTSSFSARLGNRTSTSTWTSAAGSTCNNARHLYCFEQ